MSNVDQISRALLYEGYLLYPYRQSAIKNRRRFDIGVVYPQSFIGAVAGTDSWTLRTECLVAGGAPSTVEITVRYLELGHVERIDTGAGIDSTREREMAMSIPNLRGLARDAACRKFHWDDSPIEAGIRVSGSQVSDDLLQVAVEISNLTSVADAAASRDAILPRSLLSCHAILRVIGGEFVSLLDPPAEFGEAAARCRNTGLWPVLAGDGARRDTMLAAPIILYDYPEIAPESPGELCDGTEIDAMLRLRILTLTEGEKDAMRGFDERARRILETTEKLPPDQMMKLHGAVRWMRRVDGIQE